MMTRSTSATIFLTCTIFSCCCIPPTSGNERAVAIQQQSAEAEQDSNAPQPQTKEIWNEFSHESKASFRGLHVVGNGESIWVSGSGGTVLHSTDRGETWTDVSPEGAEEIEFRDIHGFADGAAVAMGIASPAKFYRTSDGGANWEVVFADQRPDVFFDAISFWDDQNGIAFSDPIDGKLVIVRTIDGGRTWSELETEKQPEAIEGEGGFAASGTCMCINGDRVFIGLGGERKEDDPPNSRILTSHDRGDTWHAIETPLKSGAASGVFSIVFTDAENGVAVGGTYDQPQDIDDHICITNDGGATWTVPDKVGDPVAPEEPGIEDGLLYPLLLPRGYRSCVFALPVEGHESPAIVAIGKTGSDFSLDRGESWKPLSDQGFYAASSSLDGQTTVAVGADGRIGVLNLEMLSESQVTD